MSKIKSYRQNTRAADKAALHDALNRASKPEDFDLVNQALHGSDAVNIHHENGHSRKSTARKAELQQEKNIPKEQQIIQEAADTTAAEQGAIKQGLTTEKQAVRSQVRQLTDIDPLLAQLKEGYLKDIQVSGDTVAIQHATEKWESVEQTLRKVLPLEEIKSLPVANKIKLKLVNDSFAFGETGPAEQLLKVYADIKKHKGTIPANKVDALETLLGGELLAKAPEGVSLVEHMQSQTKRLAGELYTVGIQTRSLKKLVMDPAYLVEKVDWHLPDLKPDIEELLNTDQVKAAREVVPPQTQPVKPLVKPQTNTTSEIFGSTRENVSSASHKSHKMPSKKIVESEGREWFQFLTHNAEGKFSGEHTAISAVVAAAGWGTAAYLRKSQEEKQQQIQTGATLS